MWLDSDRRKWYYPAVSIELGNYFINGKKCQWLSETAFSKLEKYVSFVCRSQQVR